MVTALCIHAQDIELQTKEKYEYADATQLWRRTLNPAGLSLDTLTNRGISYFEFSHQQGTHYRVQLPQMWERHIRFSRIYPTTGRHHATDTGSSLRPCATTTRATKALWQWCRANMHRPIVEQHKTPVRSFEGTTSTTACGPTAEQISLLPPREVRVEVLVAATASTPLPGKCLKR